MCYSKPVATSRSMYTYIFLFCIIVSSIYVIQGYSINNEEIEQHHIERREACPKPNMCKSKWGYCGTGDEFCGENCVAGPCSGRGNGNSSIITEQNFACTFNTIDNKTRANRLNGLRNSGWKPSNKDEAAVFLAHVFHETDGLKTLREYCAPGTLIADINKNLIL